MRTLVSALLVSAALLAGPAAARAQSGDDETSVPVRMVYFAERKANLVMSVSFTDLFDAGLLEELSSGFVTTIVLRAYVYREGRNLPVWVSAATFRVLYDMWDEVFLVQAEGPGGAQDYREPARAEALRRVTVLDELPVAPLASIPVGPNHFVGVIVEANPVSRELLAEVRRWLARPAGGPEVSGSSSFFGSFVSVFVNPKIAEADRTLRFRSQPFYRIPR